jgi:hypothetical protein
VRHRKVVFGALVGVCSLGAVLACTSFGSEPSITVEGSDAPVQPETARPEAGDGAALPFCETVDATFCWSFDTAPFITDPGHHLVSVEHGGTVGLSEASLSAPHALRLTTPVIPDATAGEFLALDSGSMAVRCEADVMLVKANIASVALTAITTTIGTSGLGVGYVSAELSNPTDETAAVSLRNPFGSTNDALGRVPLRAWWHIALAFDGKSNIVTATVKVPDGTPQTATEPLNGAPTVHPWDATSSGAWEVLYDNVTCTY